MAKGKKTGGRQKGTPNKTTAALKDAILNAFEEVGGQAYLVMVANTDPRTFCTLLAKVMPQEINADITANVSLADRLATARERWLSRS